jgi:hypothetical protein
MLSTVSIVRNDYKLHVQPQHGIGTVWVGGVYLAQQKTSGEYFYVVVEQTQHVGTCLP